MQLFDLTDKVALVTGATSGIGMQQVIALRSAGASVITLGRRQERLDLLTEKDSQVASIVADLADISKLDAIVAECLQIHGRIDILCNTAGVNLRQHADDVTPDDWDLTQDLNLKIPFFLAQKLVPQMAERGWGKVINVASLQSRRAFANGIAYGASKGGVEQLTRAMAEAWSSRGVACNAIAPGFFPTELTQAVFDNDSLAEQLAQQTAIGRNGELEDLSGVCIFLASHASDYITGQTIFIDGGFTAK
ncbi:SDR family NAD(P)-dependent oxidoreductase [Aliamphritea ceti]|uniref:SDR family NAD(P)-dependent oxidoreductase n=1 Tax=Aliamphritea ceti TaxID=1524258 RepID=UPI0021C315D3|nr:SDR family oxidoreductase [Aliamphritea ceti]